MLSGSTSGPILPVAQYGNVATSVDAVQSACRGLGIPQSLHDLTGLVPQGDRTWQTGVSAFQALTQGLVSAANVLDHGQRIITGRKPLGGSLCLPSGDGAAAPHDDNGIHLNFPPDSEGAVTLMDRWRWYENGLADPRFTLVKREPTDAVSGRETLHAPNFSKKQVHEGIRITKFLGQTRIECEETTLSPEYWRRGIRLLGARDDTPAMVALTLSGPLALLSLIPGLPQLGDNSTSAQALIKVWYDQIAAEASGVFGDVRAPGFEGHDLVSLRMREDVRLAGAYTLESTTSVREGGVTPLIKFVAYKIDAMNASWQLLANVYFPVRGEGDVVPTALNLAWLTNDVPVLGRQKMMPRIADALSSVR